MNLPWKTQRGPLRYCQGCGQPIILSGSNPDGSPNEAVDFEYNNGFHWQCYMKLMNQVEKEVEKEEKKVAVIADVEYESAVKKLMDDLKRKTDDGHKS
jgi:hypothetical protein